MVFFINNSPSFLLQDFLSILGTSLILNLNMLVLQRTRPKNQRIEHGTLTTASFANGNDKVAFLVSVQTYELDVLE